MTGAELLQQNLLEPFRIGLLIMLFVTMLRTRAVSGTVLPLAFGAVFVAGLMVLTKESDATSSLALRLGLGLMANIVILALIVAVWEAYLRLRSR